MSKIKKIQDPVSIEILRQLLDYNPETGELFWRARPSEMFPAGNTSKEAVAKGWNKRWAGKPAFTAARGERGYLHGNIFGRTYYKHRVIWALAYGMWPDDEIDHENHITSDGKLTNLKSATNTDNKKNTVLQMNNSSGVVGVCWYKKTKKWKAQIGNLGKNIWLGEFVFKADAIAARKAGELKYGYHPNHGMPRLLITQGGANHGAN